MVAPFESLANEWRRIEILAAVSLAAKTGAPGATEELDEISQLTKQIKKLRRGPWKQIGCGALTDLQFDVLAAVVAPVVSHRVANLFANLEPRQPDGAATSGILADLFQLENEDVGALLDELADSSDLVTRRLVHRSSNPIDWRAAIRPTPALVERIMGNGQVHAAPPGSFLVPTYAGLDTLVFSDSIRRRLQEFSALVRVKNGTGDSTTPGGPVALFAGPSGVGKSAAAAAVAHDLQWPMFRVDLASLVSKYIGETEENISRLLESASGRRLVLHFEEAESLFGKRGEIREARDRYANLEVSHLLALIETHNGPCILSTNLRANVDRAFLRRFQVVVEFARPDRQQRAEIWKGLSGDRFDDDDLVMLASPELTGGDIRNAVYFADSLLAACKGGARTPIDESLRELCNDLKDVSPLGFAALAIWRELGKDGRYVAPTDLGGLADHFPAALAKAEGFAS